MFFVERMRRMARSMLHAARRLRAFPRLHFGQFARTKPLSVASGFDRGTPIDRYYIERFLAEHATDIQGRVLEVGGDLYSRRFGGERIKQQDVLHVDGSNKIATIIGNLSSPGLLPSETFDCIILTQTLQYIFDLDKALEQVRRALRPGGVALITVPAIAPINSDEWQDSFFWRFSEPSLKRLLSAAFSADNVTALGAGNLYSATAFLHGAALEELNRRKLEPFMAEYAIIITGRAVA